jgi:hypothetical protein
MWRRIADSLGLPAFFLKVDKMKRTLAALAAVVISSGVSLGALPANATSFDLEFTNTVLPNNGCCGPFNVSAILDATFDGTKYIVTGITGTVSEGSPATTYNIIGLLPANNNNGYFGWDNVVTATGGSAPFGLTLGGIVFTAAGPDYYAADPTNPVSPAEFNIYSDNNGSTLLTMASNNVNAPFNGDLSIASIAEGSAGETPLPAALPLFASGLGALRLYGWRRKKKAQSVA